MKKQYGLVNHGVLFTGGDKLADGITAKPRLTTSFIKANEAKHEWNERIGLRAWEVAEVYKNKAVAI